MPLAGRLAVLILAAVSPVLAVLLVSQRGLYREQEKDVRTEVLQQAQALSGDLSQLVDGVRHVQKVLVETPFILAGDSTLCSNLLRRMLVDQPLVNNLAVADASGQVWCSGLQFPESIGTVNIADLPYFQEAQSTRQTTVGRYAIERVTNVPAIHLATPYFDQSGGFAGIVLAAVDLAQVAERLDRPIWGPDRAILIADRDGTILVRHPENASYIGKQMTPELLALLDVPASGTVDTSGTVDGIPRVLGYVPPQANPGGFYVGVGLSRTAAYAVLNEATRGALALMFLAAVAAAIAGWVVAIYTVKRPVQRLLAATRHWRKGDLSARTGLRGGGELGQLGQAFDELAASLEQELARKELLLRELGHRTMNNLQVLGSLMKLQEKSIGDEGTRRQLEEAAGRVQAMAMTYRSLHQVGSGGAVDFAHLLQDLCTSLESAMMAPGSGCQVQAVPLILGPDTAIPMALVANELLTNAIKYGAAGQPVEVSLQPAGASWRLVVRNRGHLPADFSLERATGFGLRMISAMVTQAGGTISNASGGGWTEFVVTLPAAADVAPLSA